MALRGTHAKYTATTTVLMVAGSSEASMTQTPTVSRPLLSMDLPSLATDPTVLLRFRKDLGEAFSVDALRSGIGAKASSTSSIMLVQYSAADPDLAVRGANLLSDEIVRFYREIATARFDSLIADFNGQLATRRIELAQLDGELAAAAKVYPYIDVSPPGTSVADSESIYGRLIAIRSERDSLQATLDADATAARMTSRLISDAAPLAKSDVVNGNSAYTNVRDQYAKDFAALQKLRAFGSDRYPGIVELRATVAREAVIVDTARRNAARAGPAANPTFVAALDAQAKADSLYASDAAKMHSLEHELDRLHGQMGHGSIANDVARMRRDHGSAEAAYATIADRLAKAIADRSEAASTGSVIVLDRAQSASKASSLSGKAVDIGIMFLAVWLALTIAVMLDGTEVWFRDPQTVETIYGVKPMGSLA